MEVIREDSDKTRLFFHFFIYFFNGEKPGERHVRVSRIRHKYLYITPDLLFSKISRADINNIVLVSSTVSSSYPRVCVCYIKSEFF